MIELELPVSFFTLITGDRRAECVVSVVAEPVSLFSPVSRGVRHATLYIIINMLLWAIIATGKPQRLASAAHRTCGVSATDKSSQRGFDEDVR